MNPAGKLILTKINGIRIALLLDNHEKAVRISAETGKEPFSAGDIWMGRVDHLVPSLNAAFISLAPGLKGYYRLEEGSPFENSLKPGSLIPVQIEKEGIKTKEPLLSSDLEIAGKYAVLTAKEKGLHFSSKFHDSEKKKELKKAWGQKDPDYPGFIIRTNAGCVPVSTVLDETERLFGIWKEILGRISRSPYGTRIYKSLSPVAASVRDNYDFLIEKILTDDPELFEEISQYLETADPENLKNLTFWENNLPLSAVYPIQRELFRALDKKVWLKSGGYLIIEPTEALIAIDVNSGKSVSKKSAEEEFLRINLEAAQEIARQLILRNMSGIIIVDFINMKENESKKILLDYLKTQLQSDPIKTNIIEMTKLNLVEITRKKIRRPLYELIDISMLQ